jgi:cell wall-associated NlpC family hydrolase
VTLVAASLILSIAPEAGAHHFDRYRRQRGHIESRVKSQLGDPYRYGGDGPRGYDCSGLTKWTYRDHGARLPRRSIDQYRLAGKRGAVRVKRRKNLRRGDLVFFKTTSAKVGHVGVYVGHGKFVSATSSKGVAKRSVWDRYYWGKRWVGGVRLRVTRKR